MSAVDTKFYEKKKSSTFYVALTFLFVVLALSAGLFFYTLQLEKQNEESLALIGQLDNSIQEIEQDPNIQAYSIYEQHEAFLTRLAYQSRIPTFVSHLRKHLGIHGIESKGFNYSQGMVSTELSSQTNDSGEAYEKIVKFLRDYRELGEDASFTPQFVAGFEGYDRINFRGEFKLK